MHHGAPLEHTCPDVCVPCDTMPSAGTGQGVVVAVDYFGLGSQNRMACPGPCGRCGRTTLNGAHCDMCINPVPARPLPMPVLTRRPRVRAA